MKIACFVPSLTETLIEAGVHVIGRTRYCIHPAERVGSIPIIGGTKDMDLKLLESLRPDLVIFDREENKEEMAQKCPYPYHATHITSLESLKTELAKLGDVLSNSVLKGYAQRLERVLSKDLHYEVPYLVSPETAGESLYVIWKNPWMAASGSTFVGSVCNKVGISLLSSEDKYPTVDLGQIPQNTTLLFSTEPYPFERNLPELKAMGFPCALVDGESFSWFGIRTLRFLEGL